MKPLASNVSQGRPSVAVFILCILFLWTLGVDAQTSSFDPLESTIESVRTALLTNSTTCRLVVSSFLARIEALNPTINAIVSLNPDALSEADGLDNKIAAGDTAGKLLCVPVLLKDNYDAVGMNTTGANIALAGNRPTVDAPSVKVLRDAGAIILGKTNLHEMALEGLTVSSLGGQTINPYDATRTPGGSSGGTGAAIASSLAILGTGTDTVNSLRSPISFTQDNIGPIARNIQDLAIALTVMASVGADEGDNATFHVPPEVRGTDYTEGLNDGNLSVFRIGLLDGFWNHTPSDETAPVIDAFSSAIDFLTAQSAEIFNVTDGIYNASALALFDVQKFEFREEVNKYLSRPTLNGDRPTTWDEVYASGKFLVIPSQYDFISESKELSTDDDLYVANKQSIENLRRVVNETFKKGNFDALIYPEQKNLVVKLGSPSQAGRNGILGALTGFPVVTVPVGFSRPTGDAPLGVPIGMEILGQPFEEGKLLNIANHFTRLYPFRKTPVFANQDVEMGSYLSMPNIQPNRSISPAYPLGVLPPPS